mgnify:CR=1 FL=1
MYFNSSLNKMKKKGKRHGYTLTLQDPGCFVERPTLNVKDNAPITFTTFVIIPICNEVSHTQIHLFADKYKMPAILNAILTLLFQRIVQMGESIVEVVNWAYGNTGPELHQGCKLRELLVYYLVYN